MTVSFTRHNFISLGTWRPENPPPVPSQLSTESSDLSDRDDGIYCGAGFNSPQCILLNGMPENTSYRMLTSLPLNLVFGVLTRRRDRPRLRSIHVCGKQDMSVFASFEGYSASRNLKRSGFQVRYAWWGMQKRVDDTGLEVIAPSVPPHTRQGTSNRIRYVGRLMSAGVGLDTASLKAVTEVGPTHLMLGFHSTRWVF